MTRVALKFHRRLNFWPTCKVLGLKWCQECLLQDQIGQNAVFFKRGAFGGAILSKRCHFAVSECDPHLSQNLWEAYLLSQKQNFGLKMMPRVSPWRSKRSKCKFFPKGGLLGGLFYQKVVILPFPNVTRIFLNTCSQPFYCPRCKILGLKWCQEYLL